MNIGDNVSYLSDGINRVCEIYKVRHDSDNYVCYDILLPERNVPLERIVPNASDMRKGDVVIYQKNNKNCEAYISAIDVASSSVQIRIIVKNLYKIL